MSKEARIEMFNRAASHVLKEVIEEAQRVYEDREKLRAYAEREGIPLERFGLK